MYVINATSSELFIAGIRETGFMRYIQINR
jgi:hypothetical protein